MQLSQKWQFPVLFVTIVRGLCVIWPDFEADLCGFCARFHDGYSGRLKSSLKPEPSKPGWSSIGMNTALIAEACWPMECGTAGL
jgi:hypothetical protein